MEYKGICYLYELDGTNCIYQYLTDDGTEFYIIDNGNYELAISRQLLYMQLGISQKKLSMMFLK